MNLHTVSVIGSGSSQRVVWGGLVLSRHERFSQQYYTPISICIQGKEMDLIVDLNDGFFPLVPRRVVINDGIYYFANDFIILDQGSRLFLVNKERMGVHKYSPPHGEPLRGCLSRILNKDTDSIKFHGKAAAVTV